MGGAGLTAQHGLPAGGIPAWLRRARSDSLVRNSVLMMATTVVTAMFGYVFWAFAAHAFTKQDVGIGSAVISLCSTAALLTYLGSSAVLVERLPASERTSAWTAVLLRTCLTTAGVTVAAMVAIVPVLRASSQYRPVFGSALPALLTVVGAAAWTVVNLFGAAFIAARRAGSLLGIQTLISAVKVILVFPLAAVSTSASGLVGAWVASAVAGVGVGAAWIVPRLGLGRRFGYQPRRRTGGRPAARPRARIRSRRRARHRRPAAPPGKASVGRMLGQHLTSVGGAVTPLLLPVLVVLRLGAAQDAYFYITWMVGGAFFMVSPSVAAALFAEGVRSDSDLRGVAARAMKVIIVLLVPAMAVMIVCGRFVLGFFGASYATAGYGLLILLAASSLPDAVSNVAVVIFRVTSRLGYSTLLNLGILIGTLTAAWILMPSLGIAGAGAAWLGVQVIGAVVSVPAYVRIGTRPAADSTAAPEWPHSAEVA
jgi:O-antigen/teichoic acid export membrane protein